MAGRKQHFIPQHFQQPFSIKGSNGQIWTYRKNKPKPIRTSISDTAAQRDFYSMPTGTNTQTLDDLITDYEQNLHLKVNELRKLKVGDDIKASEIAELVTHLAIRSSYMRGMVKDMVTSMADAIKEVVSGKINGQELSLPKHFVPPAIENLLIEVLEKHKFSERTPVSGQTFAKLIYFGLREGSDELLGHDFNKIGLLAEILKSMSTSISYNAHTSVLLDTLAPEMWVNRLRELKWTVVEGPEGGAILPDCTSMVFDGKKWTSLILAGNDKTLAVALPLAPDRIALGLAEGAPNINISDFNSIAAHSSHTLFLSASCKPELESALPKLGRAVRSQLAQITGSVMAETIEGFFSSETDTEQSKTQRTFLGRLGNRPISFRYPSP